MNPRILIVVSDFNKTVTDALLAGCQQTLYKSGVPESSVEVLRVPGAFELPLVAAKGARSSRFQAVICLGCVIRGETPHFEYVCQEAARGIMQVSLETGKPVIFGVLTTDSAEQALARSGLAPVAGVQGIKRTVENKGVDAAEAALQMLKVLAAL